MHTGITPSTADQESREFETELREVLAALSNACSKLLSSVGAVTGGQPIRKAMDLQRALDVPATLAWQVHRIAHADDLLSEVETVPGTKAVRRLVRAARNVGVAIEPLDLMTEAAERFEALVRTHAGDRKTFNSIVAGLSNVRNDDLNMNHRRAAFQANSHIWGVQLRTKLASFIVHPADDDSVDTLWIGGTIDLFRLRSDTPYVLFRTSMADDNPSRSSGAVTTTALGHPLATNDVSAPGCTILTDFCSRPMPDVRDYVDHDGRLALELAPGHVGRQNAVTAFVGELFRRSKPRSRQDDEPTFGTSGFVDTPTTLHIVDLIIAEGTYGDTLPDPRAYLVSNFRGRPLLFNEIERHYERDILDQPAVVHLGKGSSMLKTSEVPDYPKLFDHVCGQLDWNPASFHVFRCRVEYPVMPASVAVGFDLPESL